MNATKPGAPPLAERIAARLNSGASVIIVQEADEILARSQVAAAAATRQPFDPATDVIASSSMESHARLDAHPKASGTLVLCGYLAAYGADALRQRAIRDVALQDRDDPSRLILIEQPQTPIPADIAGDVEIIESTLPSVPELREELDVFTEAEEIKLPGNGEVRYAIAAAVAGLPRHEAARLYARCYVENSGAMDPAWLRAEKAQRITTRLGGALTFEKTDGPDVGGADRLKAFMLRRAKAFGSAKARDYGLSEPKGLFIAGPPGTGKSLFFRYAARILGVPLLRFDIGRGFGSHVGETERNFFMVQQAATACAPCFLLLDEADKGFGGAAGSSGDSGTASRAFGSFCSWANDKTSSVFLGATANRPWLLPAEFIRPGRFDAVFCLTLPNVAERQDIVQIHLAQHGWKLGPAAVQEIAAETVDFSGAEIAQAILEAGFAAFAEDARKVTAADVLTAVQETVPLKRMAPEDVTAMEAWAKTRAKPASSGAAIVAAGAAPAAPRRARIGS